MGFGGCSFDEIWEGDSNAGGETDWTSHVHQMTLSE